jgi:hypothetical protein
VTHPRNTAGCCDGRGQVHHGEGALSFVTLCPNGCAARAWDEECEQPEELRTAGGASEKAVEAAAERYAREMAFLGEDHWEDMASEDRREVRVRVREALESAHDPELGEERSVRLGAVVESLRSGERREELRCAYCGGKEARPVCPEADRGVFACRLEPGPVESWAAFVKRTFTEPSS